MRRGGLALAVAAVAVLGLSACSSQVKGSAVIASSSSGGSAVQVAKPADLPYGDDAAVATAFATMRTWDVCALHDPEATKETLRTEGGSIEPYLDIDGCKLEIDTENHVSWEFQIDLQKLGSVLSQEKPKQETINGVQVFKSTEDLGGCTYEYPFQKVAAISLTVETYDDSEKLRACEVAKSYLAKVLPKWQNPPKVGSGATTPALRMAGEDPCKGLVPFKQQLQPKVIQEDFGLRADIPGPATCELTGSLKDGGYEDYELSFTMASPDDLEGGSQLQVAGLTGVKDEYADCEYKFGFGNEPIVTSNQGTSAVDVIEVSLPESACSQPESALNTMLSPYQAAFTKKLPEGGQDALRLGDLNPPSTAEDVGAPFDPCTVITWADFPANVRDSDNSEPHLAKLNANDPNVQTGCTFHGDKIVTTIGWGKDPLSTLLQDKEFTKGGEQKKLGGRDVIRFRDSNSSGGQVCTDFVSASKGVLAVGTNQAYSSVDPCTVNDKVVPKLTQKVQ